MMLKTGASAKEDGGRGGGKSQVCIGLHPKKKEHRFSPTPKNRFISLKDYGKSDKRGQSKKS